MGKKKENVSKADNETEATSVVEEAEEDIISEEVPAAELADMVPAEDFEALKKEYDSQKDQFLRMAAEYDNFRKRTEKEKLSTYDNATAAAVEAFLPVVDNFALALDAGQNMPDEFRKGLELIQKKLDSALEKLRVKSFGERGEKFDPDYHNAISRVDDPEIEEDHIATVYQKGFMIGERIIRHAMVQISNGQ